MRSNGRSSTNRRGSVMLDVLITAGVSSVMMGLAILSIHHLLRASETHRDAVRNGLTQQRLATLFRHDCRQAMSGEATDGGVLLKFAGSRTVRYDVNDDVVVRRWSDGDSQGVDEFQSTRGWSCKIELSGSVAQLVVSQASGGSKRTLPGKERLLVTKATIGALAALRQKATNVSGEDAQ